MSTLLEVNNLKTYFFRKKEPIPAVDGVDFHISKGETVALVGEWLRKKHYFFINYGPRPKLRRKNHGGLY